MKPFFVIIASLLAFVAIPIGIRYLIEFASGVRSQSEARKLEAYRKLRRRVLLEVYLVFGLGALVSTLALSLGEWALQLAGVLWGSVYTMWTGRAAVRLRLLHDKVRVA